MKLFWQHLCVDLGYTFFSGVPSKNMDFIFNSMNPEIMHYVPSANTDIAVKLSTGAMISGFKSGIIVNDSCIHDTSLYLNKRFEIPLLILSPSVKNKCSTKIYGGFDVDKVVLYIKKYKKSAILYLN